MAIILFDNVYRKTLYPFAYTKAIADLRMGILTMKERWERVTGWQVFVVTENYLQAAYPAAGSGLHTWIDASVMITNDLVNKIRGLKEGDALTDKLGTIAVCGPVTVSSPHAVEFLPPSAETLTYEVRRLRHPWELMQWNDEMIRYDFNLLTEGRTSASVPPGVNVQSPENIFIEPGAKLSFCNINGTTGPVYIGKNTEIMEGSSIRGPFALGDGSVIKMNSRIYGATTIGPYCMGGGEIKNSVMMGYSNKAHDGYLGDSVIGEWCNFGAGSTNSNLKNTAAEIRVWSFTKKEYEPAGIKCGVVMGDYTRVAINSSINTGSMIGISCNVFGEGLLPTVIDNFTWGQQGGGSYSFDKAISAISNWMQLKQRTLTETQKEILTYIYTGKTGKPHLPID